MVRTEKKGLAIGNPRAVAERVHQYQEGRGREEMDGSLKVGTYDIKNFFTNIDRSLFLADLLAARDRMVQRFGGRWF